MYINLKEASGLCFSGCQGCETSCCDGGRFVLAPLIVEDFPLVYENFLIAFAYVDEKLRVVMLLSNRSTPCRFYVDNLCTIYESRPPACTLYPFTPYYDEVLIDTACHAVGSSGFSLIQEDKIGLASVHPSFYHTRLEDFALKLKDTETFLENLGDDFEIILEVEGVSLMRYTGSVEHSALKMHKASLKHVQRWV